jgi:hypothetical protein
MLTTQWKLRVADLPIECQLDMVVIARNSHGMAIRARHRSVNI